MKLIYQESCGIEPEVLAATVQRLAPAIAGSSEHAFTQVPHDAAMLKAVQEAVAEKKALQPTMLLLVGIGGSSLGALAVHEALQSKFYNDKSPACKFYCFDTIEEAYTRSLLALVEAEFKAGGRVMAVIVSKSGKTTETLVNAALLFEMFKHFYKNYQDYIVLITDHNSPLWEIGQQEKMLTLIIPESLGGRFSVLSPVGLFPLGMLGVDIVALSAGAQEPHADAAVSAAILYEQYKAGKNIHDTFIFAPALQSLGAWYRQLMGESIGKKYDVNGREVHVGMTPTVSMGSNDLHSVVQLYLAGPFDKFTTFVGVEETEDNACLQIPDNKFSRLFLKSDSTPLILSEVEGPSGVKRIAQVHQAILEGTRIAYAQAKRPFVSMELEKISAFELGQFLQFKMLEIVYLGFLLNVNVFDQPQVELYKVATRELLKQQ